MLKRSSENMASYKGGGRKGKAFHKKVRQPIPEGRVLFTEKMQRVFDDWLLYKSFQQLALKAGCTERQVQHPYDTFGRGQRSTIDEEVWKRAEAVIRKECAK